MLTEDGLLLVVVLGACALAVLGTLELLWPTRPRHAQRRRPVAARDPWRGARPRNVPAPRVVPAATEPAPLVAPERGEVITGGFRPTDPPLSPPVLTRVSPAGRERRRAAPHRAPLRPLPAAAPIDAGPVAVPDPEPLASAEGEVSVVDRGLALVAAERFGEAMTLGEDALKARKSDGISPPASGAALETARLWGLVGLAKQGLDDVEGARFAFEEAIALAPGGERTTWERRLAALALTIGRRSLDAVTSQPERVDALRSAIDWLGRALAVAPDDTELRQTLTAVRDSLWLTHEALLKTLVQRQAFADARRILDEVLTDPECPPERQRGFRRLLARTMGGEAAQATAEAIGHLQGDRGDEAMAAFVRAESLIGAIPADALAPRRRQELARRVWWGYVKLGGHRLDAGAHEAALAPLFRALSFREVGAEGAEEVRAMLVRALGTVVEGRVAEIGGLIAAGDTGVALLQSEKLWSLLRSAVDQGLPQDDLADAFGKVLTLLDDMGAKRS